MRRAAILAVVLLTACGGDEAKSSGAAPPPKPANKPGAKKPGVKTATLYTYPKVEDMVTLDERKTIRHAFRERDFATDPTGTENRDPFRSYVINIPGTLTDQPPTENQATPDCSKKQMVATNYSLRDLRLVGIVSRGTRKYAMFQDSGDVGRIVHRGDCLGREKARVKDIGAGFVTLEIIPEAVANQPPRPTEERSIPLYPEELKLGDLENNGEGSDTPPAVAPPAMPPSTGAGTPGPVMPTDQPTETPTPPSP